MTVKAKKQNEAHKQMVSGKHKSLNKTMASINKDFGKGTIMKMSDKPLDLPRFSSGSLKLDQILGGGWPIGRIIELFGPEGAGKTTMALAACASMQRRERATHNGGAVAYIDAENALDPDFAAMMGVNIKDLYVIQANSGEDAMESCERLAASDAIDLIIVDSVAALVPRQEIDSEMGDNHVGLQARLMSQSLRQMSGTFSRHHVTAIFINQLREKVGVMFGNPETTPGGRALKFYSSIRLRVGGKKQIKVHKPGYPKPVSIGKVMNLKTVKNKTAAPQKYTQIILYYKKGLDLLGDIIDMASFKGIIKKAGAWYGYGSQRLGQGKAKTRAFLSDPKNKDLLNLITVRVRLAYGLSIPPELQKYEKPAKADNEKSISANQNK